jgi:autotransporter translocation and assembly factor TamB
MTENDPQQTKRKPFRRALRIFSRLALYTTAGVLVLTLSALLLLQTDALRGRVKNAVESAVSRNLGLELKIGRISGDLLFSAEFDDVRLSDKNGPLLEARRISASYFSPMLLKKVFLINEFQIEKGILRLEKGADDKWNIPCLYSEKDSKEEKNGGFEDFQLVVRRAALVDSSIIVIERKHPEASTHRIENIRFAAGLNLGGDAVSADLYEMRFDADRPKISLKNLTGRIIYDVSKQALSLKQVRIRSGESSLSLEGTADFQSAEPVWNGAVEIERLSVAEIGRLASLEKFQKGGIYGTLSVKGSIRKLSHDLALRLGGASVRSRGDIGISPEGGLDLNLEGDLRNFDSAVTEALGVSGFRGRLNSDFELKGSRFERPDRAGSFRIKVTDSVVSEYPIREGYIQGRIDGGLLRLESSEFLSSWGSATLQGEAAGLFDGSKDKRIQASAEIRDLDLAESMKRGDISGKLNLTLRAIALLPSGEENPEAIDASVSARILPSTIRGIAIQEGDLGAEWNAGELKLNNFHVLAEAFDISASGAVRPDRKDLDLTVRLSVPDLKRMVSLASSFDAAASRIEKLQGTATVAGRISGGWDNPAFEGTLDGSRIRFDSFFAENLKAAGALKKGGGFAGNADVKIENLEAGSVRFRSVNAVGTIVPDKLKLDLSGTHGGGEKIEVNGEIEGLLHPRRKITVNSLKLAAEGDSRIGRFGRHLANRGPIRLFLSRDALEIESFKVTSDQATLSLKGRLDSEKDSSLALSLNGLDLNRVSWLLPPEERISGILSADVRISGTGKKPTIDGTVRVANGSGFDVDFSELTLKTTYSDSRAKGELKLTRRKNQVITIAGKTDLQLALLPFRFNLFGAQAGLDVSVKTERLDLALLPIPPSDMKYAGLLDLTARLTGSLDSPAVNGKLSIREGNFRVGSEKFPISGATFGFEYSSSKARVDLTDMGLVRNGKRWLTANGRTGLRFSFVPFVFEPLGSGVEGAIKIDDLDLGAVPYLKKSGFNGTGRLNLSAILRGSFESPVLDADLAIHGGSFGRNQESGIEVPFSALNAKLRYEASTAAIDISLHRKEGKLLAVSGTSGLELSFLPFRFQPAAGMNLSLMSRNLRISMLPLPKLPGTDFDGEIDVSAELRGDWKNPEISGELSLREGRISMERPSLDYRRISALVRLVPGKLIIEDLSTAGEEGSRLVCKGEVVLSGFKPSDIDIRLTGDNYSLPVHPAVRGRVQPDLRLTGNLEAPRLTGRLVILQSRIDLDRLSRQGPAEIRVKGRNGDDRGRITLSDSSEPDASYIQRLAADLNVDAPKNSWLKGQGLDAEIGGSIQILKEPDQPFRMLGSFNTIRGNYNFKGRSFNLDRGTVTFIGLKDPNPNLDIEATARISRVDIIIRIGGTVRDIRLSLDSRPQMEQSEIISYLMFGRPAGSLNARNSVSVERAALGLTGQVAASELKRILGEDFFLDMITYESGDGDGSRGSIAVGKYVTPDVFVKYRQGLSADQPSEVEATYEVNKNVSVQTNVGNEKTTGVDVFFEWDF